MKLSNLRISSALNISGQSGVYANQKFNIDDIVLCLSGKILPLPTRTSIQIDNENHIEDDVGHYINHNCNPTCRIDGYNVVAIKEVGESDEITYDYSQNEDRLASPFVCSCCNKLITGRANNEI